MKHTRSLSLKREILTELTPAEMTAIAGGTHAGCGTTGAVTHASFDSCPTIPFNECFAIDTSAVSKMVC